MNTNNQNTTQLKSDVQIDAVRYYYSKQNGI